MIKLIVALGNPGPQYAKTKHNIGQMVLQNHANISRFNWKKKFKGIYAQADFVEKGMLFLIPETYMNLSGESVAPLAQFFKINVDEILVLHDELDLPFGEIQLRKGGGLAGHNGLKSINALMGSPEFYRMRIGIGRPVHGNVSNWVLSGFVGEESQFLTQYLDECGKALEYFLKEGLQKASNFYNKKKLI